MNVSASGSPWNGKVEQASLNVDPSRGEIPGGPPGSLYHTLAPARVFDTRTDVRADGTKRPVGPNDLVIYSATGSRTTGEAKLTAMVLNVTATNQTEASYLQVFPFTSASNLPATSNLNFRPGQGAVPNAVITKVNPADGTIGFYNFAGIIDVLCDKLGFFDNGTEQLFGLVHRVLPKPVRVLDTRQERTAPTSTASTVTRRIGATTVVPPDSTIAVAVNITATATSGAGYVTVWPAHTARPLVSNLNATDPRRPANGNLAPPPWPRRLSTPSARSPS